MLTPETPIDQKKPIAAPRLAIESTEFHVERRESYYKVRYFDLNGQSQIILIGRELFTNPSKVVGQLLKANADLPDNLEAAVRLVKRALADRSKKIVALRSAQVGMELRSSTRERRLGLSPENWSTKGPMKSIPH